MIHINNQSHNHMGIQSKYTYIIYDLMGLNNKHHIVMVFLFDI